MLINSIETIKKELGELSTLNKPDFIILKDSKSLLFKETQLLKGTYNLFLRPQGFQLSSNRKVIGFKYDDLLSVTLSNEIIIESYKERPILFSILFGILFYCLGGLLGGLNLAIHWLPIGFVFGLLVTRYFKQAIYSITMVFTFNDKSTIDFLVNQKDRSKVQELLASVMSTRIQS